MKQIKILDTTLRDGEQSPGCWFSNEDRLTLACLLEEIGVDIIEVGFPVVSQSIRNSIKAIASRVNSSQLCCLCRSRKSDIDVAMSVLDKVDNPRLHIFLATSDLHLKHKLEIKHDEALDQIVKVIEYAKQFTDDIQFSAEDATRSDRTFLSSVFSAAIAAGATTIGIADTVGYALPKEMVALIDHLNSYVLGIATVDISVHCHNDLGMATANSLACLDAYIDQIECTVNGIGERAGNTALEEVATAIKTREKHLGCYTTILLDKLRHLSQWVETHSGLVVQANKAIVGKNAFTHESGIHVDGLIQCEKTYESIDRKMLGIDEFSMVLGRQSGRQSFKYYLKVIGVTLTLPQFAHAYDLFKELADSKPVVSRSDIERILKFIKS